MSTQREVAEHLYMTVRQVHRLIERKVLPRPQNGAGLDLDECRKAYILHMRDRSRGRDDSPRDAVDAERSRLLRAQRTRIEREELAAAGQLARKDEVMRAWASAVVNAKGKLLAMPSHAARLVPTSHRGEVQKAIQNLVNETLTELAAGATGGSVGARLKVTGRRKRT
jgi:terminase small subunit / prophage DNA-packing protein